MGIPAFYRWLLERYPRSVIDAAEERPNTVNGIEVPVDTSAPNPNGFEFDNLYLDMNGIIHPCFHPEGLTAPETHDEVFKAVFKYLDRIFSIVRPRKLLYMALDGVAPRAKMNQQRARRFRAAKDAADEASNTAIVSGNNEIGPGDLSTNKLDSNVITPGTKFMEQLSSALQYYVRLKMNVDSGWQGIKVILSDASVPGEGEHKIMSYIRLQRNLPGFDPNTSHCLYGLDADLIMLALATHEVHFSILREDVRNYKPRDRGQSSRNGKHCSHSKKGKGCANDLEELISEQKFQFLRVWVLREYLGYELQIPDRTVKLDLERLIDDFVFMCLFVGNDFLPHVPSLEISEGAIDLLINVYKKEFVNMGGYLTDSCQVNLERVEHFIQAIGSYENDIFRKRIQAQKDWERRLQRPTVNLAVKGNQDKSNHVPTKTLSVVDKVKLGEEGWKERYYAEKFEIPAAEDRVKIQKDAVLKYVEGICWVMHYYYQGVCSWQWFYPYHYAPFASDFHDLDRLEIHFTIGKPFKPFDQLMGVLPAASAQALPISYRKLMSDPLSPILDFYPSDFELDINGKRHAWQAVCKLPFIEESRLLSEIANVEDTLTVEEKQRNSLGLDVLFVYVSHPLAAKILSFCARNKGNPKLPKAKVRRKVNPEFSHGMNGFIYISDKPVCPVEIYSPVEDMGLIADNKVICAFYKVPCFHPHIPRPPKGVVMPRQVISKNYTQPPPMLWHNKTAVAENRYSRRHIPRNSLSGPLLARMAHQLVSKNCLPKQQVNGDGSNDGHGGSKKRKRNRSGKSMEMKDSHSESKQQQQVNESTDSHGGSKTQQVIGDGSSDSLGRSKTQEVNGDVSNGSVRGSKKKKRQKEDGLSEDNQQQVNESNDSLGQSKTQQVSGNGSRDSLGRSKTQQVSGDGSNDNLGGSKTQQANGDGSNGSLDESKTQVNGDVSNGSTGGSKKRQKDGHSENKQQQLNERNDSLGGSKTQQVNRDGSSDSLGRSKMQQKSADGSNDNLGGSKTQQESADGSSDNLGGSKAQQVIGDGSNDRHGESKTQQFNEDVSNVSIGGSKKRKKRQKKNGHSENKQQQVNESNDSLGGSLTQEVNGNGSQDGLGISKTQQVSLDGSNDNLDGSKTQQANGDGSSDSPGESKTQQVKDVSNGSIGGSKKRKQKKKRRSENKQQQVNESNDLGGSLTQQVNGNGSQDGLGISKRQQVSVDGSNDNLDGSKMQLANSDGSNDSLGESKTQEVNGDVSNGSIVGSKKRKRQKKNGHRENKQQQVNESNSLGGSLTQQVNGNGSQDVLGISKTQQVSVDGSNDNLDGTKTQQGNGDGSNDSLGESKTQQVKGDVSNGSIGRSKKRKKQKKNGHSESKQQQVNESNDSLGGSLMQQVNGDGRNDNLDGSKTQQANGDGSNGSLGESKTQQVKGDVSNGSIGGSKKRKKQKKKSHSENKQQQVNESLGGSLMQQVNGDGSNDSLGKSKTQQVSTDGSIDNLSGSKMQQVNGDGSNDSHGVGKMQQVNGDNSNDIFGESKTQVVS